jgi:hypothetical protein
VIVRSFGNSGGSRLRTKAINTSPLEAENNIIDTDMMYGAAEPNITVSLVAVAGMAAVRQGNGRTAKNARKSLFALAATAKISAPS